MSQLILHKNGAYNIYGTIADVPYFESALTLGQLTEYIRQEHGEEGLLGLHSRLMRAHRTGSSLGLSLEECIGCNRAGPDETNMPVDEFIARYLTLKEDGHGHNNLV